jgi:hypothetical protein
VLLDEAPAGCQIKLLISKLDENGLSVSSSMDLGKAMVNTFLGARVSFRNEHAEKIERITRQKQSEQK